MSYNFLRDAKYIKNSELCRYDSVYGYSADFSNNGNVSGWVIYNNIYLYGCWNNVLFGSSYLNECHIGRTEVFLSVNAEKYFFTEFLLKVVDENPNKVIKGLTKGKIMWLRTDDNDWSSDRTIEFDITGVNTWEYYKLNLGPYKWWQGDINNLRFYPFTDGHEGDKFFLKSLKITSEDFWTCVNTSCSYYQFYTHPCSGSGKRSYCEANSYKRKYTTMSGINSELLLNIDNYGVERIELGTNINVQGNDMSKIIGNCISTINIGGFSYSLVECTEHSTLRISSGTSRSDSSVELLYSPAAEELGFFSNNKLATYTTFSGIDPASGFDYASTRLLQTFELNALLDGTDNIAYVHNPTQYSVEGGRRDFNEIGTSKLISQLEDFTGYVSFNNTGKTIVDMSKRVDNNGKLTHFWIYGVVNPGAAFKVLRPHNDGSFTVIYSKNLIQPQAGLLYTSKPIVSKVDCNILVNKGDLLGVYNVDLFVGQTSTNLPDATFTQYDGNITGRVAKAQSYSYGVGGFALYARGDLKQNNTILDIDLGYRLNVSEFSITGEELEGFFEFNLASCLDVTWDVNLFGDTHYHWGYYALNGYGWSVTHNNIFYGKDCLDDLVITADNGQVGTTFGQNNGLASYGSNHSYFYVNGDAEWLYNIDCSKPAEFCGYTVPYGTSNFERDPISFTLLFPNEKEMEVCKSSMYFKEENNFRKFALSTYNGAYHFKGNADDPKYTLVPKYNEISVNGTRYKEGDERNIDKYLFKNPTSDDLYSTDYGDVKKVDDHISTYFVDWTILSHSFEPIKCKGFRIFCNKHYSTKITELEVYSRVANDVSMVDNAVLYFSDYQDLWRTTGFKAVDDKNTSAFIGGTPRYFRLTLESQTKFNMRELTIKVTDQTFVYDEILLLEDAKRNSIGAGKAVDIVNTYNRPFDLTIDIPRDLGTFNNIVFWNTLSSQEALTNTEFGPTCLVYKSNDFPITYYKGQCANNCFVYGLDNLVHGKQAYYTNNTYDWHYYGLLEKDISVDMLNFNYLNQSKFVGTMSVVSSKYWRLYCLSSNIVIRITDIVLTYLGNRVRIKSILLPTIIPIIGKSYILSDGIAIAPVSTFNDNFNLGNYDNFILSGSNNPAGSVLASNYMRIDAHTGNITLSTYTFANTLNFEFNTYYMFTDSSTDLNNMSMTFEFYSDNTRIFYIKWLVTGGSINASQYTSSYHTMTIYVNDISVYTNNTLGVYFNIGQLNKFNLVRAGGFVSFYMGDKNYITTFQINATIPINKYIFTANTYIDIINIYKINFSYVPLLAQGVVLDLELMGNLPVDTFCLISTGTTLALDTYTSYDNTYYYFTKSLVVTRQDLYTYFAIDLIKRHSISIVRDYGTKANKLDLSLQINTSFSNTAGKIDAAVFNSTASDCRWLRLNILNTGMTWRSLDKLGIYPDITSMFCLGGGLNTSWTALPNDITIHDTYKNVSYNKRVTCSTYYGKYVPENVIDGILNVYSMDNCWGYKKGTLPILYIELDDEYNVGAFTMHNSYNPTSTKAINSAYRLSLDNTVSGTVFNYTVVSNISGITNNAVITHEFTPMLARRVKLEILTFTTADIVELIDNVNIYVPLGFLREIEILAKSESLEIDSESYPIVCLNLRDSFNVVAHKLFNKYKSITTSTSAAGNNLWDNAEEFFYYSDSLDVSPDKVPFMGNKGYVTEYSTTTSTGDLVNSVSYVFSNLTYISEGLHFIDWDAYYPDSVGEISLHLKGSKEIKIFAITYGTGWVAQHNEVFIESSDYYSISIHQNIAANSSWGARNINIYRLYGLTSWVAVKRDTATNYSYDFNTNKFGKDYLGTIELYGDVKYIPTEYYWWWDSAISTLSNDSTNTIVGKRSLVINYPPSTDIDIVKLKEADTFGKDLEWSINDSFAFYMYIDNINNFDKDFGEVVIGASKNSSSDFFYSWNFSNIPLDTGWNEVRLNFNAYTTIYPIDINPASKYLLAQLDIQNNSVDLSTLYIKYRGKGQPLSMCLDDFKISRNVFDTTVKYGKGLCLTYNDYLMVPLSNVTLDKGSVEFWVKMGVNSLSMDAFGELHAATLFTISSNTNDILALRIKPGNWFEVFAGNIRKQSLFSVTNLPAKSFLSRNSIVHIGIVWSSDGTGMDSRHTIRLYINNILTLTSFSTWEVSDTKLAYFKLGGGIAQTAQMYNNHSAFIYENLKIYNYCKTSFAINQQTIDAEYVYAPENFIEISKNNIDYYGVGSDKLPMVFEQVPAGDSERIYIRSVKTNKFSNMNSTAQIIVDWLTTV